MVREGMRALPDDDPRAAKRLVSGAGGTLAVGVLPVATFASGQTFFVARLHEQLGLAPYVVHATFQFSGTPGKRFRFREARLWDDPPAYYDPPYALVTWDMDVPEAMLVAAAPSSPSLQCCEAQQGHFDLVNHQLLQTRHALAIASVRLAPPALCWCFSFICSRSEAGCRVGRAGAA
jgi:arabinosyltransferase